MALSGIDAVIFGVADMAEAKRFLDDWGVRQISADADRLVYQTRDGAEVIVRPIDAPDLPAPIEPGNTVREVIWGADNAQELDKTLTRLKAGGGLETGADGLAPISSLGAEYFQHDERAHALVGERTGGRWRLGREVEVRLKEATPLTGGLLFEMLSEPEAGEVGAARRRGPAPQRRQTYPRGRRR